MKVQKRNEEILSRIRDIKAEHPFWGYRRVWAYLKYRQGIVIIRKEMVYPKGFSPEGIPICNFGYPLIKTGIDYKRKCSRYHCRKICQKDAQMILPCSYFDTGGFSCILALEIVIVNTDLLLRILLSTRN